jgi:hypothetical protein
MCAVDVDVIVEVDGSADSVTGGCAGSVIDGPDGSATGVPSGTVTSGGIDAG